VLKSLSINRTNRSLKSSKRLNLGLLSHFRKVYGDQMGISLDELEKTLDSLEKAVKLYRDAKDSSEQQTAFRDACIQRFEYCIELSWKVAMKKLGSTTAAPKPAVREMARNSLISNPVEWLEFIDARNKTSHSYDETVAIEVLRSVELFLPEGKKLSKKLSQIP
jgi:nucleotidyltransferase substrate binding protein (TIGR01987 family)